MYKVGSKCDGAILDKGIVWTSPEVVKRVGVCGTTPRACGRFIEVVGDPGRMPQATDQDTFEGTGGNWVIPAQGGGCMKGHWVHTLLDAIAKVVLCGASPNEGADAG